MSITVCIGLETKLSRPKVPMIQTRVARRRVCLYTVHEEGKVNTPGFSSLIAKTVHWQRALRHCTRQRS
jgi:hypothetical protein